MCTYISPSGKRFISAGVSFIFRFFATSSARLLFAVPAIILRCSIVVPPLLLKTSQFVFKKVAGLWGFAYLKNKKQEKKSLPLQASRSLVLSNPSFKEVLLLCQVHRFRHPRERVFSLVH